MTGMFEPAHGGRNDVMHGRSRLNRPLRVLHVVGSMNYGGVETWLMHLLRNIDRQRIAIDILTNGSKPGLYDPEAKRLGCTVISCPVRKSIWNYGRRLGALIGQGSYDVVHSHVYFFSGYVLRIASRLGVPLRVAHIHPPSDLVRTTLLRRGYRRLMTRWINLYGNCFVAASRATLDAFWGRGSIGPRHRVIYCGIDLVPFTGELDARQSRDELGLPQESPIVLTVARFVPHKNHLGLLRIAKAILKEVPNAVFVLVGEGPTLMDVRKQTSQLGLDKKVYFFQRVSNLMPFWAAADVFLFPSLHEGLGMAVVEAAAAGLPVVASDIPGIREAAQACSEAGLVDPINLNGFARKTIHYLREPRRYPSIPDRLRPMSVQASIQDLIQLYSQAESYPGGSNA